MRRHLRQTFWLRLKEALRTAGKPATQTAVARFLGITQPSVSEWNEPNKFPEMERVIDLAQQANVCVEWLLTERGPKHPPPADTAAERLWALWPHIDDLTKGEIVRLAMERSRHPPQGGVPHSKSA